MKILSRENTAVRCSKIMVARSCIAALVLALSACANWKEDGGVANHWRADAVPQWVVGETREQDVMAALGPPSQIIRLDKQLVYYYLHEELRGNGYYFIVYNQSRSTTSYDRAIFFFDEDGALIRHAYSLESLPYD